MPHRSIFPAIDGRRHTLDAVRGSNGTVVMFICNHCPYVKAVVDKIVRDMAELRQHGVGSIAIMSNDPADYAEDSFDNMKAFAARHGFDVPLRAGRNAGRRAGLRRRLHARFLRIRPRPEARLPRAPRRVGALGRPGGGPRALRCDGRRSHAPARRRRSSIRRSAARSSGRRRERCGVPAQSTSARYACHVACPITGTATTSPTKYSANPAADDADDRRAPTRSSPARSRRTP